jgi:hypothetical protein
MTISWPGDPARAARILIDVVNPPDPPLRLGHHHRFS